ncbi:MAG: hypothetical protein ACK4K0_06150 [Flavobacteriales bacterium]
MEKKNINSTSYRIQKRPPSSGRFLYCLVIFFLLPILGRAQLTDSIRYAFQNKPKPVLKLDTRNSFVTNFPAQVRGIKAGLRYGKTVRLGLGYCWLDYKKETAYTTLNIDTTWTGVKLYQHYGVAYFEYIFYKRKNWTAIIPVQLGIGASGYKNEDKKNKAYYGRGIMMVYEPAMIADYTFLKYFSVGAGVGYRLMLIPNRQIPEKFTAPVYFLRFNFDVGLLAEEIFNMR